MTEAEAMVATVVQGRAAQDLLEQLDTLAWQGRARVAIVRVDAAGWAGREPFSVRELLALERTPLPTVAALSGEVSGVTLDVALACDIRVCDAATELVRLPIGSRRLLRLVGADRSVDLLQHGARASAQVALEAGLVSQVAPEGGVEAAARAVADAIAARGPIATRLAKEAVWRGLEMPLEQALRFETDLTLLLQTTKDRAEGVRAFLEKRPPTFTGN